MKKTTLLIFMLLATVVGKAAMNEKLRYFSSDFAHPTDEAPLCGWTSFGTMQQTADVNVGVSDTPLSEFFPDGCDSYLMLDFKGYGNVPCSNSSFKEGGNADEWLISPEIDLTSAPSNVMLDFDVLCYGSTNECKYEVYVSTTGNNLENFTEKAVYAGRTKSSTSEIVKATIHKALKGVGGKKIWLAFVNKSTDAQITGFTGITLAEYDIDIINKAPSFTTEQGTFEVALDVSIMTPESCKGFTAVLEQSDGSTQEYVTDKQLNSRYNTYSFSFPNPISVVFGQTLHYTITLTPNVEGITPTVMKYTLACHEGYPATCVMEEGTGSWCGYCVRGSAALKYYSHIYGDRFIGIAVHNGDPMEVYDYYSNWKAQSGLNSFPSAWINRKLASDPAMGYPLVEAEAMKNVGQRVTIDRVKFNPQTFQATVVYSPEFCYDMTNADITAVAIITEDGCKGSDNGWFQNNYYSGTTLEEWEEEGLPEAMWEFAYDYTLQGSVIPSETYPFNHVALGIFNNYYGDNTTLSSLWEAGVAQRYTLSFDFPMQQNGNEPGVQNWENTAVTLLLLDKATGEILNADRLDASEYTLEGSGVDNIGGSSVKLTKLLDGVAVEAPTGARVELFGMDGRLIASTVITSDKGFLPAHGMKGIVTVRVVDGNNTSIKKIIL